MFYFLICFDQSYFQNLTLLSIYSDLLQVPRHEVLTCLQTMNMTEPARYVEIVPLASKSTLIPSYTYSQLKPLLFLVKRCVMI